MQCYNYAVFWLYVCLQCSNTVMYAWMFRCRVIMLQYYGGMYVCSVVIL
jgi:hypothetical protein